MSHVKTLINFFQQNQAYLSSFLQFFVITFTNFLTKGVFIKIFVSILGCSSLQLYVKSHIWNGRNVEVKIDKNNGLHFFQIPARVFRTLSNI